MILRVEKCLLQLGFHMDEVLIKKERWGNGMLDELVEMYKKWYEEKFKEVETIKKPDKLLERYNPWTEDKIKELTEKFIKAVKNNEKKFSWLSKVNGLDMSHAVSMDYGIPSHVHGDINDSNLFICLVNPNIEFNGYKRKGIRDFYEAAKNINSKDFSMNIIDKIDDENPDDSSLVEEIKNYIIDVGKDSGVFYKELKEFEKNGEMGYYLKQYFKPIISSYSDRNFKIKNNKKSDDNEQKDIDDNNNDNDLKDIIEMSKKITNLEAFPFRSKNPGFSKEGAGNFADLLVRNESDLILLSARIIIWKIVDYLPYEYNENKIKPLFIFRRFNQAWKPSIKNVLMKDLKFTEGKSEDIIEKLHNEFFFTILKKAHNNSSRLSVGSLYRNDIKVEKKEVYERIGNALKGRARI